MIRIVKSEAAIHLREISDMPAEKGMQGGINTIPCVDLSDIIEIKPGWRPKGYKNENTEFLISIGGYFHTSSGTGLIGRDEFWPPCSSPKGIIISDSMIELIGKQAIEIENAWDSCIEALGKVK